MNTHKNIETEKKRHDDSIKLITREVLLKETNMKKAERELMEMTKKIRDNDLGIAELNKLEQTIKE